MYFFILTYLSCIISVGTSESVLAKVALLVLVTPRLCTAKFRSQLPVNVIQFYCAPILGMRLCFILFYIRQYGKPYSLDVSLDGDVIMYI